MSSPSLPPSVPVLVAFLNGLVRQGFSAEEIRFATGFCAGQKLMDPATAEGFRLGCLGLDIDASEGVIDDLERRVAALEQEVGITPPKGGRALSASGRKKLFALVSHGSPKKADVTEEHADQLVSLGYAELTVEGRYDITPEGLKQLTSGAQLALCRPKNYWDLPSEKQWEIDKELGILDWDGTC